LPLRTCPPLSKRAAPQEQITAAQQQAQDLIITLKEIIKDMQTGDSNITAFQTLITNLS
jgi:hypothetical protein